MPSEESLDESSESSSEDSSTEESVTSPVPGNGVVEIILPAEPEEEGQKKMPLDIPEGVGQIMMTESAAGISASNANIRNGNNVVMLALQGTIQQNFKDLDVVAGKTAAGILATNVGGPSNKAGVSNG
jgi:hypothetical protein